MPTDNELVLLAKKGDTSAFRALIERHQDRVFTVVLGMWTDRHEAEEIAQDVFVHAYRMLPNFRGESSFATWLYRIAVNRCQDHRRRVLRRRTLAPQELHPPDTFPDVAASDTAEEIVLDAQELAELREQMNGLPDTYRLALYLHYFVGQTYKEMAETLGLSVKGVEARMARARELLRIRLEGVDGVEMHAGKAVLVNQSGIS